MQIPSFGSSFLTIAAAASAVFLLGWRFEFQVSKWIKNHLSAIVTAQIKAGVQDSLKSINAEVATHTLQIAAIHQRMNQHQRKIIQLAWAGAETTASAAIWAKRAPTAREVDLQTQDWRRIVSDEEIDHKE